MPETPAQTRQKETTRITRIPLVVVLIYAIFAGPWIILSDQVIAWLFPEPAAFTLASTVKGMAFVTVTSLLLYLLLRRTAGDAGTALSMRRPGWLVVVLGAAIIALSAAGLLRDYQYHRNVAVERLQTIANLKSGQIGDWLGERRREAVFIATSSYYPDLFQRWRKDRDAAAGQELQDRLRRFLSARGFSDVSLLAPDGRVLWSTHTREYPPSAALLAAVRVALDTRQVSLSDAYYQSDEHPNLDFVVPLDNGSVVLHAHLDNWLYPTLQAWPVPSASSEVLLVRRDGDRVLFLNDLRHRTGVALRLRLPLAEHDLPAAPVLRGDAGPGESVAGHDYRGVPVLGVVRAIPGTDWFLVAKVDRAELLAQVLHSAVWISLAGLFALVMLVGSQVVLRQRERLAVAEGIRESQAERLRALRLLAAIADSSKDAIFAKDLDGRYILFNRAACEFVGKAAVAVLGRDDRDLFPEAQALQLMETGRRVVAENRAITEEETLSTHAGERVFLATKAPLHDEAGHIIGTYGISRDITERHQSEAAMRQQAEELKARNEELERFNRATVGRELHVIEMKKQINILSRELGRAPPYPLAFEQKDGNPESPA